MWLILLAFLLASSHGQLQQDNNQDESTWNRYDEAQDPTNPNYGFRHNSLQNGNIILKES